MSDQFEQRPLDRPVRRLPEKFIKDGLALSEGALFMGRPINELTREELIAVAAKGWKAYSDQLQDGIRTMDILGSFRR